MNYDLIRNFVTVAKTKNITHTASILFVSQSTVSHRLQLLEENLGHPLIHRGRGKRSATLTEHGQAFLPIAEKWLALWQETEAFSNQGHKSNLRIACVNSLISCLLSDFFIDFAVRHPNIRLSLEVLSSSEIYTRMNQNQLDVGIVLSHLPFQTLQIQPLLSEKMYCVCSKSLYPNQGRIDPAKLDMSQEILLNWGMEFMLWHDFRLPLAREPMMTFNEIGLVELALQKSETWAIVPETVAQRFCGQGICNCLTLKNPPPDRISYLILPALPDPGTEELIGLLQQELDRFLENHPTIPRPVNSVLTNEG